MELRTYVGTAVAPYLAVLAELRIAVFRDWPYLYDGDAAYEAKYLATYARSPRSLFVLAFDGGRVVGASTAIPLADETDAFRAPFLERGIEPERVYYFGESVLLHAYRGRGLGHRFFDEREAQAQRLGGFRLTAFCAVERAADDPRRPQDHRGNEAFWSKRGYVRQEDMFCVLEWRECGASAPSTHRLRFWMRALEAGA